MKAEAKGSMLVILPSLRISGGVQEALRLGQDLARRGVQVRVLALWKHPHEGAGPGLPVEYLSDFMPRKAWAALQFPVLLGRFFAYIRELRRTPEWKQPVLLLTHFSTFPFAWMATGLRWFCFNQDLEWKFVPAPLRAAVRGLILVTSRRSRVITTNEFVSRSYRDLGVVPFAQASLWAAPFWKSEATWADRRFDVAMLLRHGSVKRPDLYVELLELMRQRSGLRCAVVTPEEALYARVRPLVEHAVLRPGNEDLRAFYGSSKVFVLLSDTEGFGLPPLEAMGSGCVPLCRDSGGVRCYMQGRFAPNLIGSDASTAEILARLEDLVGREQELAELSAAARATFAEGLVATEAERERAIDRIAEDIGGCQRSLESTVR